MKTKTRTGMMGPLLASTLLGFGLIVALLLLLAPTAAPPASAAAAQTLELPPIYYVQEGTGGDCLSSTTPCSSVQRAIDLATSLALSATGEIAEIHIAGGVYTENLVLTRSVRLRGGWRDSFTHQQPLSAPSVIEGGAATHTVRVLGDPVARISLEHLTLRHGVDGVHVEGGALTLTHSAIEGCAWQGVHMARGRLWLHDNHISRVGGDGIKVDIAPEDVPSATLGVVGNAIHAAASDGVNVRVGDGGAPVAITQNTVSQCAGAGIRGVGAQIRIEANRVFSNGVGLSIRGLDAAPVFTVVNNMIAAAISNSVEMSGAGVILFAHNTLAGSNLPSAGISVTGPLTAAIVNNIVVSHGVGITATAEAVLSVSHTLLWGNGADPISGDHVLLAPPRFVNPNDRNLHLRADSPAIDAGLFLGGDVGLLTDILTDIDGDPRPGGDAERDAPDLGADEFRTYAVHLPLILRNHPPPPPTPALAVYRLYADPADLAWLDEKSPYDDRTIPADFVHERLWNVDARYRGDTSRLMPKKCWKVFFPGSDLFQNQEELNLNADYGDQTLLRSYLSYDLFKRAGVYAPRGGYGPLYINDAYYGLMSQAEQIDELFLHRQGIEIHGNLYKPYYGNLGVLDYITDPEQKAWWYNHYYPKKTNRDGDKTDIIDFIETINYTSDDAFPETVAQTLDVNQWLEWYAVNIIIGNFEMMEKNYYLYHDLSRERWIILPWDVDLALGHNADPGAGGYGHLLDEEISWDNPIDSGTQQSKKNDGKWNILIDRMMGVPDFRFYHCRRLTEIMADEFSPEEMFPRIDAAYETIRPWAMADVRRWQPDGFQFSDGPGELKTYVANRIQFLADEIATGDFCPGQPVPLTINELMISGTERADGWIEIHNGSPTLSWDAGGMYLRTVITEPRQWRIPADGARIPPGGVLLIRVGEQEGDGLQADIPLSSEGGGSFSPGRIGLFDKDVFDNAPIDVLTYTAQPPGVAYGRWPDGGDAWGPLDAPTPGWLNLGRPPVVSDTHHTPAWPAAGAPFTVTTRITHETLPGHSNAITAVLHYRTFTPGAEPAHDSTPMTRAAPGDTTWRARLPAQADGVWVEYWIEASNAAGQTTVDRPGWPQGDYRVVVGWQRPPLYINELMALNRSTIEDEHGKTGDWIEIYNAGPVDVDMGGMRLADNHNTNHQVSPSDHYELPSGVVAPAGGYLLLWADGESVGKHLNFRLSGAGEYVGLFDSQANAYVPIDAAYFDPQTPDVSWGRFGDGEAAWYRMDDPTPGGPNRLRPPRFSDVTRAPRWPAADQAVAVSAVITAGTPIASATLWVDVGDGAGFQATPMTRTQAISGGAIWEGAIPPSSAGTVVDYYLSAVDSTGQQAIHPATTNAGSSMPPAFTERYVVGDAPPAVLINEFLAANSTVIADEAGEYDDWLELYNAGAVTVSLGGMYLTDDLAEADKWRIPDGATLAPGGHLLIWCDRDLDQGPLHADFKLSRDGEDIGLFIPSTNQPSVLVPLDWIVFGPQVRDISYGRWPDGADAWRALNPPTPGW